MNVLGICGSHREKQATDFYLRKALAMCDEAGLETEFVSLHAADIAPCEICDGCANEKGCVKDDEATRVMEMMLRADAILLASPTYFASVSGKIKNLMDRTISLRRMKAGLDNKIGGAITVGAARNGGQEFACLAMHNWMLLHGMIVVADAKPTAHFGGIGVAPRKSDPAQDQPGIATCENLGKKVAGVLKLMRKD